MMANLTPSCLHLLIRYAGTAHAIQLHHAKPVAERHAQIYSQIPVEQMNRLRKSERVCVSRSSPAIRIHVKLLGLIELAIEGGNFGALQDL